MSWRSGQSFSLELRDRVLGALDGGIGARDGGDVCSEHRVHQQGADAAVLDRRRRDQP